MTRDGVAVDSRLVAAVALRARGEPMNVAAACRELGVSRQTFYKYLDRFHREGVEGFFPRSRVPARFPGMLAAEVGDWVERVRKELDAEGADVGPWSILDRLEAEGVVPLPSRTTIARILRRRGLSVGQPRKRPKTTSTRRFEASAVNDMWQADGHQYRYRLADGSVAVIIGFLDDHSRLDLAERAAASENGLDAVAAFDAAVAGYGLPARLLTDNGSAFNGHRRGFTAALEGRAAALGVHPISSSVCHPQTCGKKERHHATLDRWLARQPRAGTLQELQVLLDAFRPWYNNRRHQGIGRLTPQQRHELADRTRPDGSPIPLPPVVSWPTVSPRGAIGVDGHEIGLAKRWAGRQTTVFRSDDHVVVFIGAVHIRTLILDRSRNYQPTGINARTGRPRRSTSHNP